VNALGSFSVDPYVAELQEIMGEWMSVINAGISATYKGYFGAKQFSMYTGLASDASMVEFTPDKDFEADYNLVEYSFPGSDVNAITVALGQAQGTKMMSRATARAKHPLIDAPEQEEELIQKEALIDALLGGIQQQAQQGTIPAIDLAAIINFLEQDVSLPEAVDRANKAAQARQASQAPPPGEGQAVAPETQPGLAAPGMGTEAQPPATVSPPPQSIQNLRALTRAMRGANSGLTPAMQQ
jgi:hypothetical protein